MSDSAKPREDARWWHRWMRMPSELREMGVVGINMRNARYLRPNNPRRLYRLVDDKLQTKALAEARGLEVPKTYGVIKSSGDIRGLESLLAGLESFVIKPARGSGGKGVLVIDGRKGGQYLKPSGVTLSHDGIKHHVVNILAGLFSLGGNRDVALIEYRVRPSELMTQISYQGAPDIRVVLMHGYPVMAMLRAATRESDGRANLHQGAVGIGIDIDTGKTVRAVHHGNKLERHPDTEIPLLGIQLPGWDRILEMAVICQEMTGLGYLGVDLMIDQEQGPMMIEVNARPGLAIQLANGIGLMKRLEPISRQHKDHPAESLEGKIRFSRDRFGRRKPVLDSPGVQA
ncbi:MAG: alpha-L-glutamate ligase-like protein [Akkermansiaceae bacterium]|nr:alpha-L-glutamate ligase-like protein [Akkermansiaceae bacterium]